MINIITAILDENINYKLKENSKFCIKYDDIQYTEGIIEILEKEKNINYLILNEEIIENNIRNFINNIKIINKNIKIILLTKNKNIEASDIEIIYMKNINGKNELINNIIQSIYENEDIKNNEQIIYKLKIENEKAKEEIKKLKEIIIEKKNEKINGKIISVIGKNGSGKTVISALLGKMLEKKGKTLIIDFDFENKSIHTIFNVNLFDEKKDKNIIKKINNNLDIISNMELVIKDIKKDYEKKLNQLFEKMMEKYLYIIIDLSNEHKNEIYKYFFYKSTKIFLLVEPNIIGVKGAKKVYEKIKHEKKKITILINKKNKYSINKKIIENIFEKNIDYEINYIETIDKIINNNLKNKFEIPKIREITEKEICGGKIRNK